MLSAAYCYSTRFQHSNIQHVSVSLLKLTRQVLILALQVQNLTQHPTFSTSVYHCTAVGAILNLSKFTGSTGKCLYSIFLESRSVLGAKFSIAYNTSIGASKYIKIKKNHYPPNFQNFPKLCITFNYGKPFVSLFVLTIMIFRFFPSIMNYQQM